MRRQRTAEMKFMRRAAGHSLLDHRRHEDILEELKVETVENKLTYYKQTKMAKSSQQDGRHSISKTTP
jgi:hypothetical protein